uniref:G domain-containing protein n=1 Tax=Lepisosteus oculatus TaxID=7918 RepID=W5LWK1_LEPOC
VWSHEVTIYQVRRTSKLKMGLFNSKPEPEPKPNPELDRAWRETIWSKQEKERLMKEIRTLTPRHEVKQIRIMITGQIKAGKSSYINTVDSPFLGHVSRRALAGEDEHSFTKSYRVEDHVNQEEKGNLPFVIYDTLGIDAIVTSPDDYVSAVKSYINDGYVFNPIRPLSADYFNKKPTVNDTAHCLVYVVAADQLSIMEDHILKLLKEIRSKVSDFGIPQVVLLTKVDKACPLVGNDLQKVYRSRYIRELIERASQKLGIPVNCILPVKNYSGEINLNDAIDVLALTSLLQILRSANGYLQNLDQKQY